jgi:hypothetical protein
VADATVAVDFVANTRGLQKGAREAQSATSRIGSSMKSLAKGAALGAAAAGVAGLTVALKIGVNEYMETQKVAAQTNAVLKSTGSVANVTAGHVSDLAEAIMKKSGIDDEAIASGENLLLTFTNIRNEAGKGNDIFDQTTRLMADMSTALGQDTKASAMQLGKALNDPIKGMTALGRVGVSFTKGQKDQVKAMVEAGDTIGAQKLIVAELTKEFGGSAEAAGKTLPGQLAIAKESFNNLMGDLVAKMIPVLTKIVSWIREHWPEISAAFAAAWAIIRPLLAALGALVASVAELIVSNWGTIGPIVMGLADVFKKAAAVIADVIGIVTALLRGDWSKAWELAKKTVQDVVKLITSILRLEAGLWRTILTAAWDAIKALTSAAWGLIKAGVNAAVEAVTDQIRKIPAAISGVVTGVKNSAGKIADAILDTITDGVKAAVRVVGDQMDRIGDKIDAVVGSVRRAASNVASAIKGPINAVISAWNGLAFHVPSFTVGGQKVGPIDVPKASFGGQTIPFPDIPRLAAGGVLDRATLFVGGEAGREIVTPERLLRRILNEEGAGSNYTLNLTTQRADAQDIAWGFRRLELLRTGR